MKSSRLFSWFNRRSYSQKFTLIGLLFVVSLAGFYPMGRDQLERRENYGVKELQGTLYLRSLQALLTDLNKHHILALQAVDDPGAAEDLAAQQAIINDELTQLAELDEKYGKSLQLDVELETIQDAWQTALQAAENQSSFAINAKHYQINKIIHRAITQIGNTSFLILDPDLDTYYMMDIVLLEMPELQDLLNQITFIVFTADMQDEILELKRLELISLSSKISPYLVQLRSLNKISWDNDETGQMRQLTDLPLNDLEEALSTFINVINDQIILSDQVNLTSEHLDAAEAAQAAATAYYDSVSQALEFGINGRIQELTNQVTFAIAFPFTIISIALVIGFLIMRTISQPLGELALAAGRLGAGERGVRVPVTGEDEVGRVGFAFNTMVSELEAAQVKQESQLDQLTQLTRALETSANVSRRLSTILDPAQLTEAVVTEVQHAFNYYHAHIYLLDEAKENLVMAGGTGEAGKTMLASGHKLALGQGLVGKAAVTNAPVLVPDVSIDPGWLPNELLPDTKAEAAIPITLGEQVLGVLDVQHNVIGGLNAESVALLQSVANQVATALENANLFTERRRANEELSRFKLALERSPNAVFMTDVDGTILYVNSGFSEVYGFSAAEAIGQTPRIIKSGLIPPEQYAYFWQTLLAKEPVMGEIVNKTKDGRIIPISASNNPIVDEAGQLMGFLSLHTDMTERKEAENLLAKQSRELSTVALVSTTAATILDPAQLLQEVVDLTKTSFDLYHAHIHLLNDNKDTLVLTAGAGEIGQKMVTEGRRIPLAAEGSLVATVARSNRGAIRNYDPPGEGFMPHPLLAETSCEMAVPIALGEEVLGILDVRSDQLNYFSDADMQTYTALAAQVAVALQNARSFARSEGALKELSELSRRLTREGWQTYLDEMEQDLQVAYDLHQVVKGKNGNGRVEKTDSALVQQIKVLGEPVGQISLVEPQALTEDAAEIVDAVANRLSVHIENLRLTAQTEQALAETAEQARRRAVLNNTSEQLNRAETLDDIFNIIAENTAKILPSDRVTLAVLSEDGDQFSVMSLAGKEENVPVRVNQPLAGSFIEKAIQTGDILVTHDSEPNPDIGIQSSMIVPLVTGSGTMGTLNVGSKAADVYDDLDQGLILQIASILSSVIENKRLLTETQQRAKELTLINRIVSQMHAAQDVDTGLQFLAEELGKVLQVPLINVRLIDDTGTMLKVVAAHHPAEIPSPVGTVLPVGKNPAGNMLLAQQMVVIEDVANSNLPPQVQKRLLKTRIRSIYIIPMMVGRDLIGSVAINLMEGGSLLTPDQLKLAETTVQQAATAVQNARLFAQEQERAAELSLINAVSELASSQLDLPNLFSSVSELLMETFAAESLYFALFDKKAQLISFPYFFTKAEGLLDVSPRSFEDGGFTGQIITDRKSVLRVAESEAPVEEMVAEGAQIVGGGRDTDCYLGTPLIVGNEVIGVLALNSMQEVRTYDEQDQQLLETLADTVGVAIQNIRQFQAAQRRAEREALINSISQKIQAAPTVQSALQTAVSELGQALKLKKAAVVLTPDGKDNGHTQS